MTVFQANHEASVSATEMLVLDDDSNIPHNIVIEYMPSGQDEGITFTKI
jgi:hypothetical protein